MDKTFTTQEILDIVKTLMVQNAENFEENDEEENMYAQGVHDGMLDILNKLGIPNDEEYYC